MVIDLANRDEIAKLDPKDVVGSTGMFSAQCQQILDEYFDQKLFSSDYSSVKNMVIAGMGGSAYGGYIMQSLYSQDITIPFITYSDYGLPAFASKDTLVFLSSYSGSTEEVLSAAEEAKKRGARITGFSSGGKLGDFLKNGYPGFTFDPKNNPSGQPRLGTGYMLTGTLVLLSMLSLIKTTKEEIQKAIDETEANQNYIQQTAQELAKNLYGYIPVIFASEHLVGNAHIIRNQFNETSKSFSAFEDIPELNHHLMEGLKNPSEKKLKVLFLLSEFYGNKHQKRIKLTEDVVMKNNIEILEYMPKASSKLSEVFNTLSFGGYITLYLGLLYGQDPSLIPWVDYFKEQLTK